MYGVIALSANRQLNDAIKRTGAYLFAAVCGILVSGAFLALFSGVMYVLSLPPETAGAMSLISLAAGCVCAGYVCGAIKQRKGLRAGLICAALISAIALLVSALSGNFTGSSAAARLITAAVASCAGSVYAVNRTGR